MRSRPPVVNLPATRNKSEQPKRIPPLAAPVEEYLKSHQDYGEVLDAQPAEADQQYVVFRDGRYLFKFEGGRITGIRKQR